MGFCTCNKSCIAFWELAAWWRSGLLQLYAQGRSWDRYAANYGPAAETTSAIGYGLLNDIEVRKGRCPVLWWLPGHLLSLPSVHLQPAGAK
jgi:hypothetical protein